MKNDIPRNKNLFGREVEQHIVFLSKRMAKKDTRINPRLELIPMALGYGVKAKATKYCEVRIGRRIAIK